MLAQEGRCAYCDKIFNQELKPTIDHIKPKSLGGTKRMSNIVLVCGPCNQMKGNLSSFEEAKQRAEIFLEFAMNLKRRGYIQ